jgi:hypothetical protein
MNDSDLWRQWTRHIRGLAMQAGAVPMDSKPWAPKPFRFHNLAFKLDNDSSVGCTWPRFGVYMEGTIPLWIGQLWIFSSNYMTIQQYHQTLLGLSLNSSEFRNWGLREKALFARCLDFPFPWSSLRNDEGLRNC